MKYVEIKRFDWQSFFEIGTVLWVIGLVNTMCAAMVLGGGGGPNEIVLGISLALVIVIPACVSFVVCVIGVFTSYPKCFECVEKLEVKGK